MQVFVAWSVAPGRRESQHTSPAWRIKLSGQTRMLSEVAEYKEIIMSSQTLGRRGGRRRRRVAKRKEKEKENTSGLQNWAAEENSKVLVEVL